MKLCSGHIISAFFLKNSRLVVYCEKQLFLGLMDQCYPDSYLEEALMLKC